MRNRLIEWGIPENQVRTIPLGVTLHRQSVISSAERGALRRRYGIDDAFCVGSWQKDGRGFDDGNHPKMIKGPDILIETLAKVADQGIKVVALLSGPARGFVIDGLKRAGVPYIHQQLDNQVELHRYMSMADACLVTSREEGGPKAILEGMALGVPVVSTVVGMAPDVIVDYTNGILCEQEDVDGLSAALVHLKEDRALAEHIRTAAAEKARGFDWSVIAQRYYEEVYEPLLRSS